MTAIEVIRETQDLPPSEKVAVMRHWLEFLDGSSPAQRKTVERLLRRLENPDVPEDVWRGIEDAEDGRVVDMETALTQKPPGLK
jgi:hypothetical protein